MPVDPIPAIAERYLVPEDKVRDLYERLKSTGGRQCQFDCEELGGPIQWMPGMVSTSRWNDAALRARVDGLCSELSAIVQGSDTAAPEALARAPGTAPAASCVSTPAGESWWPAKLGHPSTSGAQNGVRYAYFPDRHRLLIQQGARIDAYDTGEHHLNGVAQQQPATRAGSLTFASTQGPVDVRQLKSLDPDQL